MYVAKHSGKLYLMDWKEANLSHNLDYYHQRVREAYLLWDSLKRDGIFGMNLSTFGRPENVDSFSWM
jgi:hypothetical protein